MTRAGRRSLTVAALVSAFLPLAAARAQVEAGATRPAPIRFEEVGAAAGARLEHHTRDFGERYKAEVLEMFTSGGAAAAAGDIDGDGDDDLFVVDSGEGRSNHLLRNDSSPGRLAFVDITAAAGVGGGNNDDAICSDALFFDYDNDGRLDLLVARFGKPLLWRNLGQGEEGAPRFEEVAAAAGLDAFANTIAVIAFDENRDGFLDLAFGNYFQPVDLLRLGGRKNVLPNNLDYASNGGGIQLWRSERASGDGASLRRFREVSAAAGLADFHGWVLDLGHGDLDGDGFADLYAAGDYGSDRLYLNRGPTGGFRDVTATAIGVDTKKGMNVDIADYDGDLRPDIYVTNITDEYMKECNMLWHNAGDGTFLDLGRETGTCDSDWGWAAKFADFDRDGWLDLFVTNGLRSRGPEDYIPLLLEAILTPELDFSSLDSYPEIGDRSWSGRQKERLFRNLGDGTFAEVGEAAGIAFDLDGRGLVIADFDRDGRLDVFQTNADQPSLLFHNLSPGGHFLELRLEGRSSNRQAIGARVTVKAGGRFFLREVDGGNGYASQSSTTLFFGLGGAQGVESIEIRWPNGASWRLEGAAAASAFPLDRRVVVVEGQEPRS